MKTKPEKKINMWDGHKEVLKWAAEIKKKDKKKSDLREILEKYSQWLEETGYLDDDWRCEEPKAVDIYLEEL